jgi:hypothetical protein
MDGGERLGIDERGRCSSSSSSSRRRRRRRRRSSSSSRRRRRRRSIGERDRGRSDNITDGR